MILVKRLKKLKKTFFLLGIFYLSLHNFSFAKELVYQHGIAMHGDLKYPKGF